MIKINAIATFIFPLFCETFNIVEKYLSFGIHKKRVERSIIRPKKADRIPNIIDKSILSSQSNAEHEGHNILPLESVSNASTTCFSIPQLAQSITK